MRRPNVRLVALVIFVAIVAACSGARRNPPGLPGRAPLTAPFLQRRMGHSRRALWLR